MEGTSTDGRQHSPGTGQAGFAGSEESDLPKAWSLGLSVPEMRWKGLGT